MTDNSISALKRERDRFLGFAFAAADILLDVDFDGVITAAFGAVHATFEKSPDALEGRPVTELFVPEARPRLKAAFARAKGSGRMPMVRAQVEGREGPTPVRIGGWRGRGAFQVTLTLLPRMYDQPIDQRTGLLTAGAFSEQVAERLSAGANDEGRSLTMLELKGMTAATAKDPDASEGFLATLGAAMLDIADDGLASQLTADRYSMLSRDGDGCNEAIKAISEAAPDGVTIAHHNVAADSAGLSRQDVRSAIRYVIRKFVEQEGATLPDTLKGGFNDMLQETISRIDTLRGSLHEGVRLAYQPIVGLSDHKLHHYEVLVRLEGDASPQNAVVFAEDIGIVGELDLAVARMAIDRLEKGCPAPLAINVSARSLASDAFVEAFLILTGKHAKVRQHLLVELTETAGIDDLERMTNVLTRLKDAHHTICVDDFGAGAASFNYLRALPVQVVKIDGEYIDPLPGSEKSASIVRSMTSLARDLKIETIAERVEKPDQADCLIEMGVDMGQGWLYGKPAPEPQPVTPKPATSESPAAAPAPPRVAKRRGVQESWG